MSLDDKHDWQFRSLDSAVCRKCGVARNKFEGIDTFWYVYYMHEAMLVDGYKTPYKVPPCDKWVQLELPL
jgi:hypothetical protein